MQEKSIINVLQHIRAEIIHDDLGGLDAVNELLFQRGVNPDSLTVSKKHPRYFGRGKLRQATLDALRQGPAPAKEIARRIAAELDNVPAHAILDSSDCACFVVGIEGKRRCSE